MQVVLEIVERSWNQYGYSGNGPSEAFCNEYFSSVDLDSLYRSENHQ